MFPLLRQAAPIAAPVMIGYFTVGATFGLTAAQAGFGWFWPVVISLVQFAGAAQFMIVAMVTQGAALTEIGRLLMIFWLTDETYSLLTTRKESDPPQVQIAVGGLNYFSWAAGTVLGSVVGQLLPLQIDSFAFALSALFAILLTEQLRTHRSVVPVLVGFAAALLILPVQVNFGIGMFVTGLIAIGLITVWHFVLVSRSRTTGGVGHD
ncbi:MAG: AzlC family ABC transporter permease [Alphaproteobacteria bacterium]